MADAAAYAGRDLESMSFARNYHRWILDTFAPYLGTRLVEVGAGSGSFSRLIQYRVYAELAGRVVTDGELHQCVLKPDVASA